jgi:hypothetical protein
MKTKKAAWNNQDTPEYKAILSTIYGIECFSTMFEEALKHLAENLDGLEARGRGVG